MQKYLVINWIEKGNNKARVSYEELDTIKARNKQEALKKAKAFFPEVKTFKILTLKESIKIRLKLINDLVFEYSDKEDLNFKETEKIRIYLDDVVNESLLLASVK